MGESVTAVDVRDMLCAQALAVVDESLKRCQPGETITIRYNASDVKQDLLIWASRLGHPVVEVAPDTLRIAHRRATAR